MATGIGWPRLAAYIAADGLRAWCVPCYEWHTYPHGSSGELVEHCLDEASGFWTKWHWLVPVGFWPPEPARP